MKITISYILIWKHLLIKNRNKYKTWTFTILLFLYIVYSNYKNNIKLCLTKSHGFHD